MKTTVVYHSGDFDGIFCREIARKFVPDAELIGWNFGDPPLPIPGADCEQFYVMDLPLDAPFGVKMPLGLTAVVKGGVNRLVWIDHHKSAIESHPKNIPGYRIDGVAACRLAWQWFASQPGLKWFPGASCPLPQKQDFVDRKVSEPLAVRLAGEYDIWDKREPRAETLQYGLRCRELTRFDWDDLLSPKRPTIEELESLISVGHDKNLIEPDGTFVGVTMNQLLHDGAIAQRYAQNIDASICNSLTWLMEWEGLKFLCVNHARFNSLLFAARDVPETGHDALLGFRFDGKTWTVSLYHARHRTDLDLSQIAVKYGGGGHRGACGFTCEKLPFLATATAP